MSKRSWILGLGCLTLLIGLVVGAIAIRLMLSPKLPSKIILTVRLNSAIQEVTPEDPFAELMGETPVSLRKLRTALVMAAEDDRVAGVRLRIDQYVGGFATAQEIRALLARVRAAEKWTAAYLDTVGEFTPGNLEYYVASACDEVVVNPMGDVNLIGLSLRSPFIRGTLDKLGVRAEFPGRGDYKTARFFYTQTEFTPEHSEMLGWLADSLMDQLVEGIASGRGLEPDEIRNLIDRGPFFGSEAVQAGLIDELEDWGAFATRLAERENNRARPVGVVAYVDRNAGFEFGPTIAVVTGSGTILRGENGESYNPLAPGAVMGSDTLARAWRQVRETSGVRAAVFRVDSPGGSPVASEAIRIEMERTAESIPVVVSMSNVAASGGYWIACGAQRIVANPGTQTGSIGVFTGHLNMDTFYTEKLGVTFGRLDRGANANIYGGLEDWSDAQRAIVDRQLDRIYDDFVQRVADSRDMETQAVDAVGRGRVFTGEQALEHGLVDVLGGFDVALEEAKQLAGIGPEVKVSLVEYPRPLSFLQRILERQGSEDIHLKAAQKLLRDSWETGVVTIPGVVWMPPIYVR
ncbi:MAG: signal peptide peptidase SppA [bacterium]|nr:signal peptide peptidase SppA [bacterium]